MSRPKARGGPMQGTFPYTSTIKNVDLNVFLTKRYPGSFVPYNDTMRLLKYIIHNFKWRAKFLFIFYLLLERTNILLRFRIH